MLVPRVLFWAPSPPGTHWDQTEQRKGYIEYHLGIIFSTGYPSMPHSCTRRLGLGLSACLAA